MEGFSWSVSLGDILTISGLIISVFLTYHKIILRIAKLEWTVNALVEKKLTIITDDK